MDYPTRYVNLDEARLRHGDRVDRFGAFLTQGDPLADAAVEALSPLPRPARDALVDRCLSLGVAHVPEAPPALVALFRSLEHVPVWVEFERVDRGGRAFLRSGILGGIVLGAYSLILGYCSPAGNKPLALSGRFAADGARRLAETSRFVQAISAPGGMRHGADGYRSMAKVRLMHAAVRRWLAGSDVWRAADWGSPINQVDMAGTVLLFSLMVLDGLDKLGYRSAPGEREDLLHLWRYGAYLLGVDAELHCTTEAEARRLWDLLTSTQGYPDDDSVALARALLEGPVRAARSPEAETRARRVRRVGYAISRHLLGDDYAERLRYQRSPLAFAVKAFRSVNSRASGLLRLLPNAPFATASAGVRYWDFVVRTSLAERPATFSMPVTPDPAQTSGPHGKPLVRDEAHG
jgi:hypothetical protein